MQFGLSNSIQRLGAAWASDKAHNYSYSALYRDKSPKTAKWCGVPAPPSPFSHRRTRNYHQWASHGVPLLSDHARYALDRRNRMYVMVRSGFADPETGRKRHLKEQKGEPGRGRGNRTRVTPLHTGLLSDSYRTQTQNPRHPRRPGMRPTSAPTSARDPLEYTI